MKTTVEVTNKREADLVRQALADPEARVLVNVMGALLTLPDARARLRVMSFISDRLTQDGHADKAPSTSVAVGSPGGGGAAGPPLPFAENR